MRKNALIGISLFALLALRAGEAAAAPQLLPESRSTKIGTDVNWLSTKGLGSTFGFVPFFQVGLTSNVFLKIQAPIALNLGGPRDETSAGLGNPTIGVHYAATSGRLTGYVGGRVGIPLASREDEGWSRAMAYGAYSTAGYDLHYWYPKYIPIGAYGGLEYLATPGLMLRAELAPQLFIPHEQPAFPRRERDTQVAYTARLELEGRGESGFGGGAGLQWFHVLTNDAADDDAVQSAVEGFGSYDNGKFFARLGLLVAIDDPYGFGFDKGKVATLRGRIGARF